MTLKDFLQEKERIKTIKIANDHRLVRDRWLNIKRILDSIYKLLNPLEGDNEQFITLDPKTLPPEQQNLFEFVLKDLYSEGIAHYAKEEDWLEERILATSEPFRRFLSGGNVIIRGRLSFEKYRQGVSELYDFIQKDGEKRFPEKYLKKQTIEKYELPYIPDKTEQIMNEASEERQRLDDRQHQNVLQKKEFKHQRILNSINNKEDKRVHALSVVIERIEPNYPEQKNISIDYYYFNYEDTRDDLDLLKKFLETAKDKNCFIDFTSSTYANGNKLNFQEVNLKNLINYRDKLKTKPRANSQGLQSIQLVTHSLEPSTVIFLVLDKNYHIPTRCPVKNSRGEPTYIKKLYDIAYIVDVPRKKVAYNRNLANNINNALFRKRPVSKYMKTNEFKKPTLVQKSEDKETLVLKNDIQVETMLVKNIPAQHQYLYIDKTK